MLLSSVYKGLFCSMKDCGVLEKIGLFLNWNLVVFYPYGPPYIRSYVASERRFSKENLLVP